MRVLVVAAHADDEVLGCGGTIARLSDEGHEVHVLLLADGVTSRDGIGVGGVGVGALERERQAEKAARVLGCARVAQLRFRDNRMDTVPLLEVAKSVEEEVVDVLPEWVFTHHAGDLNVDHRIAHEAVLIATRPQPGNPARAVFAFEVPSSTEWRFAAGFAPNAFFALQNEALDRKIEALLCYEDEIRDAPHPRSIWGVQAIARSRGSIVGEFAAEAFQLVRGVW